MTTRKAPTKAPAKAPAAKKASPAKAATGAAASENTAATVEELKLVVAKQREDIDTLTWLLSELLMQARRAQAVQIAKALAPKLQAEIEARLAGGGAAVPSV